MTKWNEKLIKERVLDYIKIAEEYYHKDFTTDLPKIIINEDKRISKSLGCCKFKRNSKIEYESIEVTRYCLNKYDDYIIDRVIGHETGHYIALNLYGSYSHDSKFKEVCKVLSSIGIEISGGTTEIGSENHIKEGFVEPKRKRIKYKTEREKWNEFYKKKEEARYVVKCKYCDCAGYYKVARKDSIERWVLRYSCCNKKHKDSLICYDTLENIKYEKVSNELKRSEMTKEDKEICKKIVSKKY